MMKKIIGGAVVILAAVALWMGLGTREEGTREDPVNPTTIRVGSSFSYYPFDFAYV